MRRIIVAATSALVALAPMAMGAAEPAPTSTSPTSSTSVPPPSTTFDARAVARAQALLDEALGAEAPLVVAYLTSQHEQEKLTAEIAAAEARMNEHRTRVNAVIEAEQEAESRHAEARLAVADALFRLSMARVAVRQQAVRIYAGGEATIGVTSALEVLRGADDLERVQAALAYAQTGLDKQNDVVGDLHRAADALAAQRQVADRRRDEAIAARAAAEELARQLERDRQSQLTRQKALAAQIEREQQLIEEIRAKQDEYAARVDKLRGDSQALGELLSARIATGVLPREPLVRPVGGKGYVSGYGRRVHPIYGDVRMHEGVDLNAEIGTPIRSAAKGEVIWAAERGGYGIAVLIDHGGGLVTVYAHLSEVAVGVGQRVDVGRVIGYAGNTGDSAGPHLHFEVRVRGVPVDPMVYLEN